MEYLGLLSRLIALLVAVTVPAIAQRRIPVPSDEPQRRLIAEANEFRDNQDVPAAVVRYEAVLKQNPDNVDAMFELASCYYLQGEFEQCRSVAARGVEYESDHLSSLYIMLGASEDALGNPQAAEKIYREGLRVDSRNYLLHYNLAVTCITLKRWDAARGAFQQALLLNPNHASTHFGIGQLYFRRGYRVPALMALTRALVLEPLSSRAESALRMIRVLLQIRAPGDSVHPRAPMTRTNDEGHFGAIETLIPDRRATRPGAVTTLVPLLVHAFTMLPRRSALHADRGFAAQYYVPYFTELAQHGYATPLVLHVTQSMPEEARTTATEREEEAIVRFLTWSRGYVWPARSK